MLQNSPYVDQRLCTKHRFFHTKTSKSTSKIHNLSVFLIIENDNPIGKSITCKNIMFFVSKNKNNYFILCFIFVLIKFCFFKEFLRFFWWFGGYFGTNFGSFFDPADRQKQASFSGASALWQAKNTLEFRGYPGTQTLKTQIG